MKKLSILLTGSVFVLAACGKSPIDIVKDSYIDRARTLTVNNGLSKRPLCRNTKWESFKDEKGRMLVQYSCEIVDGDDFLKPIRDEAIHNSNMYYERDLKNANKMYEEQKQKIEEDFPNLRGSIEHWQGVVEKYQSLPTLKFDERARMGAAQSEVKRYEELLWRSRKDANSYLENATRAIQTAKKEMAGKEAEKNGFKNYPVYKNATELFQWVINAEGYALLAYGEIQVEDESGQEKTFIKYTRPEEVLVFASQAKQGEIVEYTRAMGMASFIERIVR
ncbi:hypothetical protein ACFIQF_19500 [Comamonas sp. J-3]|uniref:hypothetical protein n=1 Tax=Comamonas trifloxystrobinivorans TaxID=3350256 RepID=UPI00372AA8DC